ncbi:MAG: DUF4126 family protein [Gemmatimonadota bacterium]|nr:MAG: DUF4126 family protein [Gemmatimonadota bacterium]
MEATINHDLTTLLLSVLACAAAFGLSLYAALAAPSALSHLGLLELPEPLSGLGTPLVWVTLVALALVELAASRFRLTDLLWSALHTIIRPPAAALFASAALEGQGQGIQWGAALLALAVALFVHIPVLAAHTASRTAGPAPQLRGLTSVQLVLAGAIATIAWTAPPFAAVASLVPVLAPLPWWPRLWGAAHLAIAATLAVITRAGRYRQWDAGPRGLPRWLSRAAEAKLGVPLSRTRSARVCLARIGTRWLYLRGRLVVAQERTPLFAHRRGFRARLVPLQRAAGQADHQALVETVVLDTQNPYSLCLGPDAPPGPAILAALAEGGGGRLEPRDPGAV